MAKISKPVVYEHFGDKESLYAIVVDREMTLLMSMMTESLTSDRPRVLLEQAATALFDYIDTHTDGFRVLLRPHPRGDQRGGTFGTVIREVADHLTERLVVVLRRVVRRFVPASPLSRRISPMSMLKPGGHSDSTPCRWA